VPSGIRCWTLALLLALFAAAGGGADEPALPKANLTLVLERSSLRIRNSVPVHLLIENPSGVPIRDLALAVRSPRGFTLQAFSPAAGCTFRSDAGDDRKVPLGAELPAHSLLERDLCLQVGSVEEADLSLLFVLSFRFPVTGGWSTSASTSTQQVQVGLLGTSGC
jgi:hypothetical protein